MLNNIPNFHLRIIFYILCAMYFRFLFSRDISSNLKRIFLLLLQVHFAYMIGLLMISLTVSSDSTKFPMRIYFFHIQRRSWSMFRVSILTLSIRNTSHITLSLSFRLIFWFTSTLLKLINAFFAIIPILVLITVRGRCCHHYLLDFLSIYIIIYLFGWRCMV